MPDYQRVCGVNDVGEGAGKCFTVGGRRLAVFNRGNGRFAAIDDGCTHMGASLAEGACEDERVICPWHGAAFSLHSGQASGPPARGNVKAYATRVSGDAVEVEL